MAQKLKPLPDIFPMKNLRILFIGTSPGIKSATTGHYYAGDSNVFWKLLYQSGLTKKMLRPTQDKQIIHYGYGLTDIVKPPTINQSSIKERYTFHHALKLHRRLNMHNPKIAAFVGKKGFRIFMQKSNLKLEYGFQYRYNQDIRIFLLPSTSGQSYNDTSPSEKLAWFRELRKYLKYIK